MRYSLFDGATKMAKPINKVLESSYKAIEHLPFSDSVLGRIPRAALESASRLIKHYPKRGFNYEPVTIDGVQQPVLCAEAMAKPFCKLLHFRRQGLPEDAPKVLFAAALSGHHATLSRETFRAFLGGCDVYVTDWLDARDVPLSEGKFGFEDYAEYIEDFLQLLGAGTHVVALCQAGPPVLCATAYMAAHDNPCRPATLTLMASPIDNSVNPGSKLARFSNLLATRMNLLQAAAIHKVPARYPGAGRYVYPGALQLGGFMSLNLRGHIQKNIEFIKNIIAGNELEAEKHREFYDEYMATLDMDADYYLETVERVFLQQELARGLMTYKGERVDCGAIKDVALLTMEGEEDDMVSLGQTQAALTLCTRLPAQMKKHHVQRGVGHYGIFNGKYYRQEVVPVILGWVEKFNPKSAQQSPVAPV